jgi:hypothetical protein
MIMMESIENKGITAPLALKNEVAGKIKPLFALPKRRILWDVMRHRG